MCFDCKQVVYSFIAEKTVCGDALFVSFSYISSQGTTRKDEMKRAEFSGHWRLDQGRLGSGKYIKQNTKEKTIEKNEKEVAEGEGLQEDVGGHRSRVGLSGARDNVDDCLATKSGIRIRNGTRKRLLLPMGMYTRILALPLHPTYAMVLTHFFSTFHPGMSLYLLFCHLYCAPFPSDGDLGDLGYAHVRFGVWPASGVANIL